MIRNQHELEDRIEAFLSDKFDKLPELQDIVSGQASLPRHEHSLR